MRGHSADFNYSFSDIWGDLDFAGLVHVEARNDECDLFLDPVDMNLSHDGTFRRRRTVLPGVTPPARDVTLERACGNP